MAHAAGAGECDTCRYCCRCCNAMQHNASCMAHAAAVAAAVHVAWHKGWVCWQGRGRSAAACSMLHGTRCRSSAAAMPACTCNGQDDCMHEAAPGPSRLLLYHHLPPHLHTHFTKTCPAPPPCCRAAPAAPTPPGRPPTPPAGCQTSAAAGALLPGSVTWPTSWWTTWSYPRGGRLREAAACAAPGQLAGRW